MKTVNAENLLVTRLSTELKNYPDFIPSFTENNSEFTIIHFAGAVKYDLKNMIAKNTDKVMHICIKNINKSLYSKLGAN